MDLLEQATQPTAPPYRKRPVKRHPVIQPDDLTIRYIQLTKGQVAIVDAENYEELAKYNWDAVRDGKTFYAERKGIVNGKRRTILMHRVIMKAADDQEVDHRNGNGCHNTYHNMRDATRGQNACNQRTRIHPRHLDPHGSFQPQRLSADCFSQHG